MIRVSRREARWLAESLGAVALAASGCLPIPTSYTLSPPIVGNYRQAEGPPVAGARFLLTTAYGDSLCATPTSEVITDSAGVFGFAPTGERYRWFVLLPFDRAAPTYTVCVETNEGRRRVYRGVILGRAKPDSITCVVPMTVESQTTSCSGLYPLPRQFDR
jgi:hypothetical protein